MLAGVSLKKYEVEWRGEQGTDKPQSAPWHVGNSRITIAEGGIGGDKESRLDLDWMAESPQGSHDGVSSGTSTDDAADVNSSSIIMAGHGNHCSFVLLAEFHILEGAQLKYQFPQPLGIDEGYVPLFEPP